MLHKCVVGGCPNRSDSTIHYSLPEDPSRRGAWLQFIELNKAAEGAVSSSCRLCGDHFSEEDYFCLDLGQGITCRILGVDAVPTVRLGSRSDPVMSPGLLTPSPVLRQEPQGAACDFAISDAVSLACVKEEPEEYELSAASLDTAVKHEDAERSVTEDDQNRPGEKSKLLNCSACGLKFACRRSLVTHQHAMHRRPRSGFFTCPTCGEMFLKKGLLVRHRVVHTDRSLEKSVAHRTFHKTQQKLHEDGLPYACDACPRRFGYRVALAAHKKRHRQLRPKLGGPQVTGETPEGRSRRQQTVVSHVSEELVPDQQLHQAHEPPQRNPHDPTSAEGPEGGTVEETCVSV